MKKYSWIPAFFVIFTLVFAGLISCTDPDDNKTTPGKNTNGLVKVTIAEIPGEFEPIADEPPADEIEATSQYTGTISWENADGNEAGSVFTEGMIYTATITLTAKTGYTFKGVSPNFFQVYGAEDVSNDADSGIITAKFPATKVPKPVTLKEITGLKPAAGATIITEIESAEDVDGHVQFRGNVTWEPELEFGIFLSGTTYTATVAMSAGHGFTLKDISDTNFFTSSEAATINYDTATHEVTATFAATEGDDCDICAGIGGCTYRLLNVAEEYPFTGLTYINDDSDLKALRDAPVYSSFVITLDLVPGSSTNTLGRIGEGAVQRNITRGGLDTGTGDANRTFTYTIADIWEVMDCQTSSADHSVGDRFGINPFAAQISAINSIMLHIPNVDPRPACWKCGVKGCIDCFDLVWSLENYLKRTDINWAGNIHTFGSQLPLDSNRPSQMAPAEAFSGKPALWSSSAYSPLNTGSGNGSQYLVVIDNGSLVITTTTGQHLQILLGAIKDGEDNNLDIINNKYYLVIKGSNLKTWGNAQSRFSLVYNGMTGSDIVSAANYTNAIDINALLPVTNINPTTEAHMIRLTSSNASATEIFQIRINTIELRYLGPR